MRAEYAAFRSLLEAVPNLPIGDGTAPEPEPPLYVVLYDQSPRLVAERMDASTSTSVLTVAVMQVGTSPNEVAWAVEKVEAALKRVRLTVGDRTSTPLKKISASAVRPEEGTNLPKWFTATDVWRCAFDRA